MILNFVQSYNSKRYVLYFPSGLCSSSTTVALGLQLKFKLMPRPWHVVFQQTKTTLDGGRGGKEEEEDGDGGVTSIWFDYLALLYLTVTTSTVMGQISVNRSSRNHERQVLWSSYNVIVLGHIGRASQDGLFCGEHTALKSVLYFLSRPRACSPPGQISRSVWSEIINSPAIGPPAAAESE